MNQHKLIRVFSAKKCKFSSNCRLFSESSAIGKEGGSYCGVYRELNAKRLTKTVSEQAWRDKEEIASAVNSGIYEPIAAEAK